MKKPWTIRLISMRSGLSVAYAEDMPRFWTYRAAMRRCRLANRRPMKRTPLAIWLPVRTRRSPW